MCSTHLRIALLACVTAITVAACSDETNGGGASSGDSKGPLFPDADAVDSAVTAPDDTGADPTRDAAVEPPSDTHPTSDGTDGPAPVCEPGNRICQGAYGDEVWLCRDDGSGRDLLLTCAGETVCASGLCQIPCTGDLKHNTNVGCDYFAVDLQNGPAVADYTPGSVIAANVQFAVVVSNPDRALPVRITVHDRVGGPAIASVDLPAGGLEVFPLGPRNVEGTSQGMLSWYVAGNRPFIAYQFNPLDNTTPVFSNDASLLLPASGVGREYIVVTGPGEGFITVVATQDDTAVSVRPTRPTEGGPGIPALSGGDLLHRTLQQGEVLNVKVVGATDLSGSEVTADKDVIVFGGSTWWAATRTTEYCCADHMEQQMIPVSGWGKTAVAVKAPPRGREPDYWRIIAADDDTTLTFSPPVSPPVTLRAREVFALTTAESFIVTADKRIQVAQILASSYQIGAQDKACGTSTDCPSGQSCYSGRCRAPCTAARSDCEAGGICTQPVGYFATAGEGLCLPDRCNGAFCSAGAACDGWSCHATCTDDAQCGAGASCVDSGGTRMCTPRACATDGDCPAAAMCYPGSAGKRCLPRCQLAPGCPDDGFVCTPSRLVAGATWTGDLCFEPQCHVDGDCMSGYNCGAGGFCEPTGDPALILTLAAEQFRNSYVFLAPDAYLDDWVTIVAPTGASVTLDDVPVTAWQSVGPSWIYARLRIADGVHRVVADQPVGVTVYGYDDDVSYGYPAGTRLADP